MSKIERIINSILLSIIGLCLVPLFLYFLVYIYYKLNIPMLSDKNWRVNMGDIFIYFGVPLSLVGMSIYKISLNRYYKLINETENIDDKEDKDDEILNNDDK